MFGEGLFTFLSTNTAVKALVGTSVSRGDKTPGIFPMVPSVKEPTLPFIAYLEIFGSNEQTYEGPNRLMTVRYRIACWGSSYGSAKTLANTVKLQLNGYQGTFGEGSIVLNAMDVTETDTTEDLPEGTVYGTHLDFEFSYQDHSDGH